MKFLNVATFIVNSAIRSSILILVFMTLIGQNNPDFFTVQTGLLSLLASFVLISGLRLILRRLDFWPYVVACIVVAILTFLFAPIDISYQLMLIFCLITAGIPQPHDFEWAFYLLPAVFYLINFVGSLPVNQIFALILLWLLFLMQCLMHYQKDMADAFEKNAENPTFSAGTLVKMSKTQFSWQFGLFVAIGLVVIGLAVWQKPFMNYDDLRFNSAQVDEPKDTTPSSETAISSVEQSTTESVENNVTHTHTWLDSMGDFFGSLVHTGLLLIGILIGTALIIFILVRAFQQIRDRKKSETPLYEDGDAVILTDSTPFKKYADHDSSTNKRLRLRYKKNIEHEFIPKQSEVPSEQLAKMPYLTETQERLLEQYEKARYSGQTMTKEELREFTALLKQKTAKK